MAVDAKGDISATTTTSGLSWKIPARGDSPIIGRLLRGHEVGRLAPPARRRNIKISGGHTIIEMMRQGKTPTEACLEALGASRGTTKTIRRNSDVPHLFYALNKTACMAPLRSGAMVMRKTSRLLTRCTMGASRDCCLQAVFR